jgi:hypothetical protein
MDRLEDLVNFGIAIALGKTPAEKMPAEDIRKLAEAAAKYVHGTSPLPAFGESARIELPSTLNDFRDLAKRVAEHTTETVYKCLDSDSKLKAREFYGDIYKQLLVKEAPKNEISAYVASGLGILGSLERLARERLGAEVPQELNFANYLVAPMITGMLGENLHQNAVRLMDEYVRPKSFVVNVKDAISTGCADYFKYVNLVIGDNGPEFISEKEDKIIRISYKSIDEATNKGEWLVHVKIGRQPFWGVRTKDMDDESYASGIVKTEHLGRALMVTKALNHGSREDFTYALGMLTSKLFQRENRKLFGAE